MKSQNFIKVLKNIDFDLVYLNARPSDQIKYEFILQRVEFHLF